jgi:hypothetical protein
MVLSDSVYLWLIHLNRGILYCVVSVLFVSYQVGWYRTGTIDRYRSHCCNARKREKSKWVG